MSDPSPSSPARRSNPALLQRRVRDVHLYLGLLIAPSVLFFAATGAVQLFGWHEREAGRDYTPPPIVERLAMAHKKQAFTLPRRRPPPKPEAGGGAGARAPSPAQPTPLNVELLKWFFLVVSLGLIVSTCLGLWLGLRFARNRRLAWGLLIAGVVIPILLLAI